MDDTFVQTINGVLNKSVVYLAGPIDNANDDGRGWRQEFTEKVQDLGIKILDPTFKPKHLKSETAVEKYHVNDLKKNNKFQELKAYVKLFRRIDLRFVDLSDFVVIYIDPDVHMMGSYDEILTAEDQQKPIFAIIKGGHTKANGWLFGVVEANEMFETVDECVDHLRKINDGEIPLDDRWVLIRDYLSE